MIKKISKAKQVLNAFIDCEEHCVPCALKDINVSQSAIQFKGLKDKDGYQFKEYKEGRWSVNKRCDVCESSTAHRHLLSATPVEIIEIRAHWSSAFRLRVIALFDSKDAFTGSTIGGAPEVDHRTPARVMNEAEVLDEKNITDEEIKSRYMLLSREHNLMKDRVCGRCEKNNTRGKWNDVNFFYEGNEEYKGSCVGCPFAYPEKWVAELNKRLG